MTYISGAHWNVTLVDGRTVTWIDDAGRRAVVSVLDPEATHPARRVLYDGTAQPLGGDAPVGLTVYGVGVRDRPSYDHFRLIAPDYAYLVDGIEQGRGITHHRITDGDADQLLTTAQFADRIGVTPATLHRYRSRGELPEPDRTVGRTPLWLVATADEWQRSRPGRGAGGGRPRN